MSTLFTKTLLVAAALAASSTMALAQDRRHDGTGERREARQEQRIKNGLRDGSLTGREAAALIEEQRRIDRLQAQARADGRVTDREADQIRRAQKEASRHIYQERHDADARRYRPWSRWN